MGICRLQNLSVEGTSLLAISKMDKFKPMTIKGTQQKIYQTTDATQPAGVAPLEVKEAWKADRGGWRQGFEDGIGKQRERSELHTSEHKKKGYRLDLQSYNNQKGEAHFAFQEKDAVYGQVHLEYDPKIPDHVPGKTIGKALVAAMGECLDTRTIWEVKYDGTGMLFARYFRQTWVGKPIAGKDRWFQAHRLLMSSTVLFSLMGLLFVA